MQQKTAKFFLILWFYWIAALSCPAWGEEQTAELQELQAAIQEMKATKQNGPTDIPLHGQAVLKLPEGYVFIPMPAAGKYMKAIGNADGDNLLGLVFGEQDGADWMVVARYIDSGYIKDDEAKTWNVDELLESYREGTEEGNKERVQRGFSALEVVGWVEKPIYDENNHRLVWSLAVKDKGAANTTDQGVNYNTYALGREGYISLNLVADLNTIESLKPRAHELLATLHFNNGKHYADFNESTDKVAEYGLAALVGGFAAKKLGLLALGAAFFAKFAKIIIASVLVFGTGLGKILGRKKSNNA